MLTNPLVSKDAEGRDWSDVKIAEWCAVSDRFVAGMREECRTVRDAPRTVRRGTGTYTVPTRGCGQDEADDLALAEEWSCPAVFDFASKSGRLKWSNPASPASAPRPGPRTVQVPQTAVRAPLARTWRVRRLSRKGLTMDSDEAREAAVDVAPGEAGPGVGLCLDALALLPERTILDERRLAALFGVTDRTVRRMVQRRELPPGVRRAGRCCWMAGLILAHFEAEADRAAKEAERTAARIRGMTA